MMTFIEILNLTHFHIIQNGHKATPATTPLYVHLEAIVIHYVCVNHTKCSSSCQRHNLTNNFWGKPHFLTLVMSHMSVGDMSNGYKYLQIYLFDSICICL